VLTPLNSLYYTQFVGNPGNRPVIKGATNFSGVALIDTVVAQTEATETYADTTYHQHYRQIRNFVFDLTQMPNVNCLGAAPVGIHWVPGKATSLENLAFVMPVVKDSPTNAVGVRIENVGLLLVKICMVEGLTDAMRKGNWRLCQRSRLLWRSRRDAGRSPAVHSSKCGVPQMRYCHSHGLGLGSDVKEPQGHGLRNCHRPHWHERKPRNRVTLFAW
jgi:hypothetical protein